MARRRNNKKKHAPFASGFEKEMFKVIKNRKHPKQKVEYEEDELTYVIVKKYNPDFKITKDDGSIFYIETKGYFPYVDRVKMLAVKETNPNADIRFVFYRDDPVRKSAKMRYSDWSKQYGFEYSIGTVPKDWFS